MIGNNAYTSLPRLKTAEADAREVSSVLKEVYGFETKLLLNATRQQIISALYSYRHELNADANLFIYYAGHGVNDKDADKAYWLPVDASLNDNSNWIIADEITTALKVIPAKHVLIVSDSCYSGTLTRGIRDALPRPTAREQFIKRMAAGRSRTLMASGGDEPVADGGGDGRHSVFANALLRGLQVIDKGQFTGAELFRYHVEESVAGRANQTPEYSPLRNSGHESGDFIFIRIKTDGKNNEVTVKSPASPAGAVLDPAAIELSFWESIKASTDAEDFKAYLKAYPAGRFAPLAWNNVRRLEATVTKMPANTNTLTTSLAKPSDTIALTRVMNTAFADDYSGKLIKVLARFVASGQTENYIFGAIPKKAIEGKVAFRVSSPDQTGDEDVPFGTIPPHVFIDKAQADLIFELKKGDLILLTGSTIVGRRPISVGQDFIQIVFVATSIEKKK